jgi:regulator of sigma E protease
LGFNFNAIWQTILLLSVMVVVHEYGHFRLARAFGVTVHEFSIGFGPLIGKFNWKGVVYSIRWVLLGGFVRIAGMDISLEGGEDETPVKPEQSFQYLALWKKVCVIAAGPFFNLILAVVLVFVTAAFVGLPSSLRNEAPIVEQAIPGTPAFEAGLRPGDRILIINQKPVKEWKDISALIKESGSKTIEIKISRQGETLIKKITPSYSPVDKRYTIGITGVPNFQKTSIPEAAKIAVNFPWNFTQAVYKSFAMMFRGEIKGGFMGPIGMVSVIEQNSKLPLYYNLFLAIQISMFLCIFNMLPIPLPLLDGGWIVILLLERLLHREFSAEQKAAAQMVGLMAMVVLGILVTYGDFMRMFKRFFGG